MSAVITRWPCDASIGASLLYIRPSISKPWISTIGRGPLPYSA
jgi:hypothetical protein